MTPTRMVRLAMASGAALVLLPACGDDDSPSGPLAAGPEQYAGVWEGETGAGRSVSMVVGPTGVVESFEARVRLSVGLSSCTGPLILDTSATIRGNAFSAQVTFPGSNVSTTIQGTFGSAQSVGGRYDGFSGSFSLVCGGSFSVGVGSVLSSGTWQASKTGG